METAVGPAAGQAFTFWVGGRAPVEFRVVRFRGTEAVSRLYTFDVDVAEVEGREESFLDLAVGRPARLTIQGAEAPRTVAGIVRGVQLSAVRAREGVAVHRARLGPRLWLLGRARHSRIFQDLSVPEVVAQVLDQHRVAHRAALTRRYGPRPYCVQHHETDLHFVARLLAEEGIFYFFDHPAAEGRPADAEVLVLGDTPGAYAAMDGPALIPLRDAGHALADEEHVTAFRIHRRLRPARVKLREFDFERPSHFLEGDARADDSVASAEFGLEVYDHHLEFEGDASDRREAAVRLEQLRARKRLGEGAGCCPRMTPGRWFALDSEVHEVMDGHYTTVWVEHHGELVAAPGARALSAGSTVTYRNRFRCVRRTVAFRPPPVPRVPQQGLETATVVGPAGEEIYTDEFGRIKVQFHWDLQGRKDERSSCWVRTMQGWSGAHWGFQFVPRIGMEVLVSFVGGDADRPLVVGCVHNGENRVPFALPQLKSRSGVVTRSTPGGDGYNELSFEDARDQERVHLRAQRDLDELVLNDHQTTVGRDQTNTVRGDHAESVGGRQRLTVEGARVVHVKQGLHTEVGGDEHRAVTGAQALHVRGSRRDVVEGDLAVEAAGGVRLRTAAGVGVEAGRDLGLSVGRDVAVRAARDLRETVGGSAALVVQGDRSVVVAGAQTAAVHGGASVTVTGDAALNATGRVTVRADAGLVLRCGDASIELCRDEVRIVAPRVSLWGHDQVGVRTDAARLRLDQDLHATAATVALLGRGARLELDGQARLQGATVSLASGAGARHADAGSSAPRESDPREWVVRVTVPGERADDPPRPLASRPFVARGHGPEPFAGQADGDGVVRIPVVYPRCVIALEVDGHAFTLDAGGLHPADDARGLRQRLHNLGYGPPGVEGWDDAATRDALRGFQRAHGLEDTGRLTDETRGALARVHRA